MSRKYCHNLLRVSVAQICQNIGWHSAQTSSLETLTDVLEKYISTLGATSQQYAEHYGRTEVNLNDLGLAFQQLGINLSELEDYVRSVEPVPFAHEIIHFPAANAASNLSFPNPRSREIMQIREEHIPAHLPYMLPNMKDEIPEDRSMPSIIDTENTDKSDADKKDEPRDKRLGGPIPSSEAQPNKRPRFGNSYLPEDIGHSQYEMTSVIIGPNGVLTTRQGVEGRLPLPCMPPPNPRLLNQGADKENTAKAKDAGTKITIGIGGIGVNTLPSIKFDKKSKKSVHKKSLISDGTTKAHLEIGKDLTKKIPSKTVAKFLKKLKASKKSSKLFAKTKSAEVNIAEEQNNRIRSDIMLRHLDSTGSDSIKIKRKKEKKSVAIITDSDEELRNLPTPSSSCRSSPEHLVITDGENSAVKKAQLEAINDSINSVLREGPVKEEKVKKSKKKEHISCEHVSESPDGKMKRRPGRPPKKLTPTPPPPPIDVKPFVSDKYSSKELQVYEFNDSPPQALKSASRQNTIELVSLAPPQPTPVPTSQPQAPVAKPKHEHNAKPKVHRRIEPEDELFAPEIKIETAAKAQPKLKAKEVKKEIPVKDKQKSKNEKLEKEIEKNKPVKENSKNNREKLKDKDHRKEKRDKKKEKERKKKHKDRERDREKDKLKKIENKIKQEDVSREPSPANVLGVKLKIKIGGSSGPSSMMVTGDSSSATPSPSSLVGSKRDSVSPHKIIPKLYISKSGAEEKPKNSSKVKEDSSSKHKSSPMTSVKSSPSSPSARTTPTPSLHSKTPTPPPSKSSFTSSKDSGLERKKEKKERKARSPVKGGRKEKKKEKEELSSLSEDSSLSPPTSPAKSTKKHRRQTPPKLQKVSPSSSTEKSPPSLPFQSPSCSPRPSSRATRSPSGASTRYNSSVSPPPLSRSKPTPPPSLSPEARNTSHNSPSPTRPPTPGSTSPRQSPDWTLTLSPTHHRSPTPTPRTPTVSPKQGLCSPSHSSPPGSPVSPRKSTSPVSQVSRPGSRTVGSSNTSKDIPSPVSSKSTASTSKPARTVEAETVCIIYNEEGKMIWICPACKQPDDGTEMIGCDTCDNWYHWPCVGITEAPPESQNWYCDKCLAKTKSSRGRGRPRGRGRGKGKKKM